MDEYDEIVHAGLAASLTSQARLLLGQGCKCVMADSCADVYASLPSDSNELALCLRQGSLKTGSGKSYIKVYASLAPSLTGQACSQHVAQRRCARALRCQ